jgi:hypothetical protein
MKKGYYWIKDNSEWIIAEYLGAGWYVTGNETRYEDSEIDSFYPIPIELPDILKQDL